MGPLDRFFLKFQVPLIWLGVLALPVALNGYWKWWTIGLAEMTYPAMGVLFVSHFMVMLGIASLQDRHWPHPSLEEHVRRTQLDQQSTGRQPSRAEPSQPPE